MIATSYQGLIKKVMEEGFEELNQRTGLKTRRILGAIVDLEHGDDIFSPRKMSPKIAAAEATWMLMGDQSTEWISRHTKIWTKFEDDGRPGFISTAYGYRLRTVFGRDQIQEAVELIQKDPSSRQCLLLNWDPRVDGLMNQGKSKNVPCPFSFQLLVKAGFGHMIIFQRSADVIIGISYDLMYYYILGQALFNSAGYPFQGLRIMIADAHVYENLYHVADKISEYRPPEAKHMLQHSWDVADILRKPDDFVEEFRGKYRGVDWPVRDVLEAAQ